MMNIKTAIAICMVAIATSTGCENKSSVAGETGVAAEEHKHTYRCPMNCEKGKTYDKEGKCPVCGMPLEHFDGVDNGNSYTMKFRAEPSSVEAGKPAVLSFTPSLVGKENQQVPLDVQHEKKIHLIVVSDDLSYFEHIHPEYQADGSYRIKVVGEKDQYSRGEGFDETRFAAGGKYFLFADYLPSGGSHQVEKIELNVKGNSRAPVKFTADKLSAASGEFTVQLQPDGGKLIAGKPLHIAGKLMQNGSEVDVNTLENYLGAKAHMVVISLNDKEYLHVHPDVNGGKFDLNTTFKTPGIYRGWLQFKSKGKVHTVDFVLDVK
jgi:hypothetical protein